MVLPASEVTIQRPRAALQLPRRILLLTLQRAFLIHVGSLDDGSQFSCPSGNIAYPVLQYTGRTSASLVKPNEAKALEMLLQGVMLNFQL